MVSLDLGCFPFFPRGPTLSTSQVCCRVAWEPTLAGGWARLLRARRSRLVPLPGGPHSSEASSPIISRLARIQRRNPWRSELLAKRKRILATTSAWNSAFPGHLSHWAPASLNPLPSRGFCRTLESAWGFCSANCAWNRL
jgi:hypothetical protein